jgi:hypothetical protein
MIKTFLVFFCAVLFVSCSENSEPPHNWVAISGRDGKPLYRIKTPHDWNCHHTDSSLLSDSMKALCEFQIEEGDQTIRITIHNFPSSSPEGRIPPMAQIARWKRQFEELSSTDTLIIPQSFSGYIGFYFEGIGKMKEKKMAMMGWALQIAPEHYTTLSYPTAHLSLEKQKQMRADVTIKVIGHPDMVQKHKQTIKRYARSFELIEEIPVRS